MSGVPALCRAADLSLYRPKMAGRNTVDNTVPAGKNWTPRRSRISAQHAGSGPPQIGRHRFVGQHFDDGIERQRRHAALFQVLADNDISHWADHFLERLKRPASEPELPLRLRVVQ
jgi:hypothetical protein